MVADSKGWQLVLSWPPFCFCFDFFFNLKKKKLGVSMACACLKLLNLIAYAYCILSLFDGFGFRHAGDGISEDDGRPDHM